MKKKQIYWLSRHAGLKTLHVLLLLAILFSLPSVAQPISGIINNYAAVTNISGSAITVNSSSGFASGDKIMIIQMKGATIFGGNSNVFGLIFSTNNAGKYEFLEISSNQDYSSCFKG